MAFKKLEDTDLMPGNGKHAGTKMIDVPASYLLWWLESGPAGNVKDYARDNKEVLLQELESEKTKKSKK
jgi:uncharacterized protein (DUF3820 family)